MPRTLAGTQTQEIVRDDPHGRCRGDPTYCSSAGSIIDKATDQLTTLGFSRSAKEVDQHIVNNPSTFSTIQSNAIISRPHIPRSEINEIICDAHMNYEVEKEIPVSSKAMAVKGVVDPHALYPGGA